MSVSLSQFDSNIARVEAFFQAIKANDQQALTAFFDKESVFNNMPMGPVKGPEAIWHLLEPLHEKATAVEYTVLNIAEDANGRVLTERLDRYYFDQALAEFPVMGIFEFDGEIIREWRDYFDLKQCMDALNECIA